MTKVYDSYIHSFEYWPIVKETKKLTKVRKRLPEQRRITHRTRMGQRWPVKQMRVMEGHYFGMRVGSPSKKGQSR